MSLTVFSAGEVGRWRVECLEPVIGASLAAVSRLSVSEPSETRQTPVTWSLRGVAGHVRYTRRDEQQTLAARQAGLGRPEATRAALIPLSKSAEWWALAQDERRSMLEEISHHITIGLEYLPAVARRLYHGRDLGEPFDFLTWFEYSPQDGPAFEELLARLRATPEWQYVDREVDIRLAR